MRKLPPDLLASLAIQTCRVHKSSNLQVRRFPLSIPLGHQLWRPYSDRCRSVSRAALRQHSAHSSSRRFSLYPFASSSTPSTNKSSGTEDATDGPSFGTSSTESLPRAQTPGQEQHLAQPIQAPNSTPRPSPSRLPFKFETGVALFAKRTPRPFPPPFLSRPSGSFSDPLSTHDTPRLSTGEPIRGCTNGDDAVFASDHFICANDGVGAWSTRPRGHAGLWARLILHFWAAEVEDGLGKDKDPDPVRYLQAAYERTKGATSEPNEWLGTTTATGAQLHYAKAGTDRPEGAQEQGKGQENQTGDGTSGGSTVADSTVTPLLYVTNLGDSQVMVIRPSTRTTVYKTTEQWHWFDCPRQLGTNSPDTPRANAVVDAVHIREGDIVLAMSDGVIDNLWAHEIVESVSDSVAQWEAGGGGKPGKNNGESDEDWKKRRRGGRGGGMEFVAHELVERAKKIALDPFAESPFMEHAIEEGLPSEGGKLDDISVVAALCTRNDDHGDSGEHPTEE